MEAALELVLLDAEDDYQKKWLGPLGPAASVAARAMFLLNRTLNC